MIQAVADKIVVEVMRAAKTKGGLLLPDNVKDPQGYGRVLSLGDDVANKRIKEGDILVFHPMAGMDTLMDNRIFKVLKYEELYGILQNEEIEASLEALKIGGSSEGQQLVQPVGTRIIQ